MIINKLHLQLLELTKAIRNIDFQICKTEILNTIYYEQKFIRNFKLKHEIWVKTFCRIKVIQKAK